VGKRDAYHVAVCVVVCTSGVVPGQGVRFVSDSSRCVETCPREQAHGVVDPFLDGWICSNQPFRMLLDPGFVTNFRHEFSILDVDPVGEPVHPPVSDGDKAEGYNDFDGYDECRGCD
jgi:hypothetical protein